MKNEKKKEGYCSVVPPARGCIFMECDICEMPMLSDEGNQKTNCVMCELKKQEEEDYE